MTALNSFILWQQLPQYYIDGETEIHNLFTGTVFLTYCNFIVMTDVKLTADKVLNFKIRQPILQKKHLFRLYHIDYF